MIYARSTGILWPALVAIHFLAWSSSPVLAFQVTFDWATVGNVGNAGEPQTGQFGGTFGAVDYAYQISKYEVTNAQYTTFLNAVDPAGTNSLALYNTSMGSDVNGGVNFSINATIGSKYSIKPGRDNNPVVFVSFFDAMRFTNWLQNGQGNGSTESGVYTIGNGINETRNPGATYFIPSENEWYKAAYHKNDGVTGNYWDFPTSTDVRPYSDQPPGSDAPNPANTGNFFENDGIANGYNDGYAVPGLPLFNSQQHYLTDVGAYGASLSPYGTFDQGGNVWELTEALRFDVFGATTRSMLGGDCLNDASFTAAWFRNLPLFANPSGEGQNRGFRVASIPEPSTLVLVALGTIGLLLGRRR